MCAILLVLHGCANIQQPGGGPKDIANPLLLESVPKNGALNYKQRKITLTFDEQIAENSLQRELIIAPYMDNTFRSVASKNKLSIEFDKDLPANSTISLNFRNGVKDVHEGSLCRNLHLVFSTGPEIDTLQINGSVNELLNKQPAMQATVALYPFSDTLNVYKQKPLYFTKTDSSGHFKLANLKEGNYELIAFTDRNNNLSFENKTELLAFLPETVKLPAKSKSDSALISNLNMELALSDAQPPKRLDDAVKGWTYRISYNENITSAQFQVREKLPFIKRINKKNLILTSQKAIADSVHLLVMAQDSSGNSSLDTLVFLLGPKPDSTLRKKGPIYKLASANPAIPSKPIKFEFTDSVKTFNPKGITYRLDSGKLQTVENFKWNPVMDILEIEQPIFRKTMQLYIDRETFTLLTDSVNKKRDTLQFKVADDGNFGTINCAVIPGNSPYLIQLLNDKYELVEQVANVPKHVFRFVPPGGYYLRVIEDANGNGQWDSGNYKKRILPEKARVFKDKIMIKANWEIEEIKL